MKPWSTEEIQYLINNYPHSTGAEIAKHLNRTAKAVSSKAMRIGLAQQPRKIWTIEELRYLEAKFPEQLTKDIAHNMGRTYASIVCKAKELGLKKSKEYISINNSFNRYMQQNHGV